MFIRKVLFYLLSLSFIGSTYASTYKYEQFARNFYSLGFNVSKTSFSTKGITFPITRYVNSTYRLVFTSSFSETVGDFILVCDNDFNYNGVSCNKNDITSDSGKLIYEFEHYKGFPEGIYRIENPNLNIIVFPEKYLVQPGYREHVNRYFEELYRLDLGSVHSTILDIKSDQFRTLLKSPLAHLFILVILSFYFYLTIQKRDYKQLMISAMLFCIFCLLYLYSKKDYFLDFYDYLLSTLLPNYNFKVLLQGEFVLLLNTFVLAALVLVVLLYVTTYLSKFYSDNIRLSKPINTSLLQVILLVLVFNSDTRYAVAASLVFILLTFFDHNKLLTRIFVGVIIGLTIHLTISFIDTKSLSFVFGSSKSSVILPNTISISNGLDYNINLKPTFDLYAGGYLVFSPTYKTINNVPIQEFTSKTENYMLYNSKFNDSIMENLYYNNELFEASKVTKPGPFVYFNLTDEEDITFEITTKCLNEVITSVYLKPYYYDADRLTFRRDASRVSLFDEYGCDTSSDTTTNTVVVTKDRFRLGINLIRLSPELSNRVLSVKILSGGQLISNFGYLNDFYKTGIFSFSLEDIDRPLVVYSTGVREPLSLSRDSDGLNLGVVIAGMVNKGIIKESIEIGSGTHGQMLYFTK